MDLALFHTEIGEGPLLASAIHDGSQIRAEVAALLKIDAVARRLEEDPHTGAWTAIAPTRVIARRSRFEVDFNRPREKAVYQSPGDAWGLELWEEPPPRELVDRSLTAYDEFYAHLRALIGEMVARHRHVVLFDLHTYNHRRAGRDGPVADPQEHPEINLGTGTMDRAYWGRVVDRWLAAWQAFDGLGRRLDVRENVKFFGGNLARWVHQEFPQRACVLAIEVKKFFMDEWTGQLDEPQHQAIGEGLARAADAVLDELTNWPSSTGEA